MFYISLNESDHTLCSHGAPQRPGSSGREVPPLALNRRGPEENLTNLLTF